MKNETAYGKLSQVNLETFKKGFSKTDPAWIQDLRCEAYSNFLQQGFPTHKQEGWRFTPTKNLLNQAFHDGRPAQPASFMRNWLGQLVPDFFSETRIVFINGYYSGKFSTLETLPEGVLVTSFSEAILSKPELVKKHLAQHVENKSSFAELNSAFSKDGSFVYIPEKIEVPTPIHLIYVSTEDKKSNISYPRNLIISGAGSESSIIENYIGDGTYFTNSVTEIVLEENSTLNHTRLQQESLESFHLSTTQVHQKKNSHYNSHSIDFGSLLARNDLRVGLKEVGSEASLNGLYLAAGNQHVDNQTCVDHAVEHTTSDEVYKGILKGDAKGVFSGKIIVRPDAQKSAASQYNRNLLLSNNAQIHTSPQLQIDADDVKCAHGATVGQLSEDALFYLRSRGIEESDARASLTAAFASDSIGQINSPAVRRYVSKKLFEKLEVGHSAGISEMEKQDA